MNSLFLTTKKLRPGTPLFVPLSWLWAQKYFWGPLYFIHGNSEHKNRLTGKAIFQFGLCLESWAPTKSTGLVGLEQGDLELSIWDLSYFVILIQTHTRLFQPALWTLKEEMNHSRVCLSKLCQMYSTYVRMKKLVFVLFFFNLFQHLYCNWSLFTQLQCSEWLLKCCFGVAIKSLLIPLFCIWHLCWISVFRGN